MERVIVIYITAMNILGFALMGIDKSKARRRKRRIRESSLLLAAFLGGSAGALSGMLFFRHKTKHIKFKIAIPLAVAANAAAIWYLAQYR